MEIILADNTYRIGKLSAIKQLHVVRRLLPALASMGVTIAHLQTTDMGSEAFLANLGPISEVIAGMPDKEAEYIIFTCMSVVQRKASDGRFSNTVAGEQMLFQDIDMVQLVRLTVEVVKENLQGFFVGLGDANALPSS